MLLFHEFATNAAKYGALSVEEGKLNITATMKGEILEIVWLESGGPRLAASDTRAIGFGSRLEQIISQSLEVEISREWMPNGLTIRLSIPRHAVSDNETTQPCASTGLTQRQDVNIDAGRRAGYGS